MSAEKVEKHVICPKCETRFAILVPKVIGNRAMRGAAKTGAGAGLVGIFSEMALLPDLGPLSIAFLSWLLGQIVHAFMPRVAEAFKGDG